MEEEFRRIPNWLAPQGDSGNQQVSTALHAQQRKLINQWMEDIATELLRSLKSDTNPYPRVDDADKDLAIMDDILRKRQMIKR
ncbi:MAG: hypothetical protein EOO61_14250 [Hymenobacter sp.]|nr:MAG: hypothetical protein EOO61_14250 [Hymenobacter sp.]